MNMATVNIYTTSKPYVVRGGGGIVAETRNALVLAEDGQADRIFFPRSDIALPLFDPSSTKREDPLLGVAEYFHLAGKSKQVDDVAWSYTNPKGAMEKLAGYVTFDSNIVTVEEL